MAPFAALRITGYLCRLFERLLGLLPDLGREAARMAKRAVLLVVHVRVDHHILDGAVLGPESRRVCVHDPRVNGCKLLEFP